MNVGLRQLIDRSIISPLQRKGVRLLTKAALFVLAAFAFLIAILFAIAGFFIWLIQMVGAIIASLTVAGVFLAIAIIVTLLALYGVREKDPGARTKQSTKTQKTGRPELAENQAAEELQRAEVITEAIVPLLEVLRSLGWKREEIALLASAELAKKLPPLTLVGLAIICGFLIGRMNKFPFDLTDNFTAKKESG